MFCKNMHILLFGSRFFAFRILVLYIDWKPLKIQTIWQIIHCNQLWNFKVIAILLNLFCINKLTKISPRMRPVGLGLPRGPGESPSPKSINLYPSEASLGLKYEHYVLTHWGLVTHICVGKLAIIGSDNGLPSGRRQAIIWTNAGILLIRPLGTNFSEILIATETFSFKKMHLKISSTKWRPFCLGLNVLTWKFWYSLLLYGLFSKCPLRKNNRNSQK